MNFLELSGIVFWVIIATYVLIVVRLWWIQRQQEKKAKQEWDEYFGID